MSGGESYQLIGYIFEFEVKIKGDTLIQKGIVKIKGI